MIKFEKPHECPVCFETLRTSKPLSCGHWVHKKCIVKSLKNECPICRKEVELNELEQLELRCLQKESVIEEKMLMINIQESLLEAKENALLQHTKSLVFRERDVKKRELYVMNKENELRELESSLKFKKDVVFRLFCIAVLGIFVPPLDALRSMIFNVSWMFY